MLGCDAGRGFRGSRQCSGHPCQKHPSTKMATLGPRNVRSGRPHSVLYSRRYLRPLRHSADRNNVSGFVPWLGFRAIPADRALMNKLVPFCHWSWRSLVLRGLGSPVRASDVLVRMSPATRCVYQWVSRRLPVGETRRRVCLPAGRPRSPRS